MTSVRPLTSYVKVRRLIGSLIRNRRWFISPTRTTGRKYLEIGCGPERHEGFIHLDYEWRPNVDICWDVTKGIPLSSESMDGIFTEHCLEHVTLNAADSIIAECFRVLTPGGLIRISVPDGHLYLKCYVDMIDGSASRAMPYASEDNFFGLYAPIMSVNRIFRSHGHLFIHDFGSLRILLEKNGFTNVRQVSFGIGNNPDLLVDSKGREIESLYLEASKPIQNAG